MSPFLKLGSLVVKHKSIEGGMGLHFFENFAQAGGTRSQCIVNCTVRAMWMRQPSLLDLLLHLACLPAVQMALCMHCEVAVTRLRRS